MNRWGFLAVGILLGWLVALPLSDAAIPPTKAFTKIFIGGDSINATSYDDSFTIVAGNGIDITVNEEAKTITISTLP